MPDSEGFEFDPDLELESRVPNPPSEPLPETQLPEPEAEEEILSPLAVQMTKAQYYWDIRQMAFFENPDSLAQEVEAEVHEFIESRLKKLIGLPKGKSKKGPKRLPIPAPVLKTTTKTIRPVQAKTVQAKPVPPPKASPKTAAVGGEEIIIDTPLTDGNTMSKKYVKMVDIESKREYYLGHTKSMDGTWVGDGNKYTKQDNNQGGFFFRVMSQQALPPGVKQSVPLTASQFTAQSQAHAMQVLENISRDKNSGGILTSAIALAHKS